MSKLVLHPQKYVSDAKAIKDALAAHDIHGAIMLDGEYRVLPESEMLQCVKATHTDAIKYQPEIADCDKIARAMWARIPLMFGINSVGLFADFAGRHCFCLVLVKPDDNSAPIVARLVEPQTDAEVAFNSSPPYQIVQGKYLLLI